MVRVKNVEQEVVYKLYCTPFLREDTHNISCYAAFALLALAISKEKKVTIKININRVFFDKKIANKLTLSNLL